MIEMIKAIEQEENASSYIKTLLKYVLKAGESKKDPQSFIEAVEQGLSQPIKEEIMTIAEQFRQQGMQQGIMQGESNLLSKQLLARFDDVSESYIMDKIRHANQSDLETWGLRFVMAKSIHDVFNG
jgi:hypothetical protein